MLAPKKTVPDENDQGVKQSLQQKSGVRPPLQDLISQPSATPESKSSCISRSRSSIWMLTPLLNKMPAQMVSASETENRVKVWVESQQKVGSQSKLGKNQSLGSDVCKPDPEKICTPLQRIAVHIQSDGPELEFKDENSENYFISDDVASTGLYSSFARSTPIDRDSLGIQNAECSCNLNSYDYSVPPSEVPEKCISDLRSTALPSEFAVVGLCQTDDISTTPYFKINCQNSIVSSAPKSEPQPGFNHVCRIGTESTSFEAHRCMTADKEEDTRSVDALSNQGPGLLEKGRATPFRTELKENVLVSIGVQEIENYAQLHANVLVPPNITTNNIPDQPLTVAESPLPQSDSREFVADTWPLGEDGKKIDAPSMSNLSLLGEHPLDSWEVLDAHCLDSNASSLGTLALSALPDTIPITADARTVFQSGDEVEVQPTWSDVMVTEGAPSLTDIEHCTREIVHPPSFRLQGSSKVVSGRVSPQVISCDREEMPNLNCGVEELRSPLLTGTTEEGALSLDHATTDNVAELFICAIEEKNHLCIIDEHVSGVQMLSSSPFGQLPQKDVVCGISLSHISSPEKQIIELELCCSPTFPPLEEATEQHLSGLDSLECVVRGERSKHLGNLQDKDEKNFLQSKQCTHPILHIKPAELATGMDGTNSPLQPANIQEKMIENLQISSDAFSTAYQFAEDLEQSISPQSASNLSLLSSCAVTCLSPVKSLDSSFDTLLNVMDPRQHATFPVSHQEVGTTMTPVSTSAAVTWVTPLALLERSLNTTITEFFPQQQTSVSKSPMSSSSAATWMTPIMIREQSMNTSTDFSHLTEKRDTDTQDSAVGTDSLLWNFSREHLSCMPRLELENRLENTLTVIEVLSRQLQDWQKSQSLDARLGPSGQRDVCVQTAVTHTTEEQQHYYNLYARAMERVQELQRCQSDEVQLAAALKNASQILHRYQKEDIDCIKRSCALFQKLQADSDLMQAQCEESRELLCQHQQLMHRMTKPVQLAKQEQANMKSRMDQILLDKQKLCSELSAATSELHGVTMKNEQLSLETTRLSAELASLMESLSELKSEREALKERASEQFIQLSTKDEYMVYVEEALKVKTARLKEIESQTWQMSDVMLGREQALSEKQRENEMLQDKVQHLEHQQTFLQEELNQCINRLKQMAELKTQLGAFEENMEFFEQESTIAREENDAFRLQVTDLESQLKANLEALRERSYQCELKKDEVAQLQKERDNLQEELKSTKEEARSMLLKMGHEITESSFEVNQAKAKLLCLMGTLKAVLQGEDLDGPVVMDFRTPAGHSNRSISRSCTKSRQKVKQDNENPPEDDDFILGNGTSAFTKVLPKISKSAVTDQCIASSIADLQSIITDLMTTASHLCHVKKEAIGQLKDELASEKAKLKSLTSCYNCDVEELKLEIEAQKTENRQQAEILNVRQQNMKQLQAMLQQQEERVLQLLTERKEVENLYAEISQLKHSLQLLEAETEVLRNELSSRGDSSVKAWVQEKILLQREVTKLRLLLIDTENSKSEVLQKTLRHKQILERNLQLSEQEVKKLDNLIETIREKLLTISDTVTGCKELEELVEYLG